MIFNILRSTILAGLLLLAVLFIAPVSAKADALFDVRDIRVDARARSASEARVKALAQGQTQAFGRLLKRITRTQDWPVLPNPSEMNVPDYVLNFRVEDEKSSNRRYLASMSVRFDSERVLTLLRSLNIPYIEAQAKPALVIPLLKDASGYRLWDDNWWRQSWSEPDLINVPAPIVLPRGEDEDIAALNVEDVLLGDTKSMAALAARYNANAVIVVHAVTTEKNRLDVTIYQYSSFGSRLFVRNFKTGDDPSVLGSEVAAKILAEFSAEWKNQAVVQADQQASFTLAADYDRMSAWLTMLDKLKAASFVKDLELHVLSSRGAVISISYTGSVDQLAANLAQSDLILIENETGWRLRLR